MNNYFFYTNGTHSVQPIYFRQPPPIIIHTQQRMPITLDIPPQNIILRNDKPQPIYVRQQKPNIIIQNEPNQMQMHHMPHGNHFNQGNSSLQIQHMNQLNQITNAPEIHYTQQENGTAINSFEDNINCTKPMNMVDMTNTGYLHRIPDFPQMNVPNFAHTGNIETNNYTNNNMSYNDKEMIEIPHNVNGMYNFTKNNTQEPQDMNYNNFQEMSNVNMNGHPVDMQNTQYLQMAARNYSSNINFNRI